MSKNRLEDKVVSLEELKKLRYTWKNLDNKVVFTNGCFDILHAGHVSYLHEAKEQGDILLIGLNSDASVSRLKGKNRQRNWRPLSLDYYRIRGWLTRAEPMFGRCFFDCEPHAPCDFGP